MSTTPQEAQAIAEIRANMEPMRELAIRNKTYFADQWKELTNKGQSAIFDIMEERRLQFHEEYRTLRVEIIKQLSRQVNYMEDRTLPYSTEWENLIKELRPYLAGISALGTTL